MQTVKDLPKPVVNEKLKINQSQNANRILRCTVRHIKYLEGRGSKMERWLQDDEPDAAADVDVYDERVHDDNESDDVGDDAPSTPVQTTRRGRVVKPREIYSP